MEPRDVRGIQIAAGAAAAGFVAAYCIGALGGLESKHVEPEPEPVEAPLASHPDGRRRVPTGHEKDQAEWTLQLWEAAEETASTEEREVAKQGILKGDSAAVHAFERSVFKRVSRLAKGSSHDEHPLMLQTHVWLEAEDGKHRYGSLLFKFYRHWAKEDTKQSFFYWLDFGGGKDLQSVTSDKGEVITRTELEESCVQYCTAEQRKKFVVKIEDGLLRWPNQSNKLCHTESLDGPDAFKSPKSGLLMMIYVMSPEHVLYVADKRKGHFHHSSFLGGAATVAAGSIVIEHGKLKEITPHSGHYQPSEDDFARCCQAFADAGVDMTMVEKAKQKVRKKKEMA